MPMLVIIRRLFLVSLLIPGALFAADNTQDITLHFLGYSIQAPLYLVLFLCIGAGFIAGSLLTALTNTMHHALSPTKVRV